MPSFSDQLKPDVYRKFRTIKGSPLVELELRKTRVEDLSPLMESPLERLFLPGSPIRSLNPLTFAQ